MGLEAFGVSADPVEDPQPEAEVVAPQEAAPVQEEPEAVETPAERLVRLRDTLGAPDESASGTSNEIAELKGHVDGRLATIQDELRNLSTPDEPAPNTGPHGINFDDPNIGEAFREVYDSDDPQAFGRAVGAVVSLGIEEVKRTMQEQYDEFKDDASKARTETENNDNFASNMSTAIPHIRSMGEPEDAIVEDYLANGEGSFLGEYLHKYPMLSKDVPGILGAAMAVARMVEIAGARVSTTTVDDGASTTPPERSIRTEAAPSRGSNQSVQRIRDDSKGDGEGDLTPGEQLKRSVVNATRERALPRVFH